SGVRPPQLVAGVRIPSVEKAARGAVAARDASDENPVRDQRGDDPGIAFLEVREFLLPDLLSGLHVERDDVRVDLLAKQLAVVDGGAAAHDDAGVADPRRRALVLHRRPPDLLAGPDVERARP